MNRKKFKSVIESWIIQKKYVVKASTFSRYNEIVNIYILPFFGNYNISKIDNELIGKYVNYLTQKGLSNKTLKDIIVLLKQILSFGNINVNVLLPKLEKKEIIIIDKDSQKIIENYVISNLNNISVGILLSLYTGIRIGELCSLKWNNFNLQDGTISIEHTINRIKNFENNIKKTRINIDSPKSFNSKRRIPILKDILELITKLHEDVKDDNYYFLTNEDYYIEPRSYYNKYKKIMKSIGLEKYNFHVLRHTFATRCIELGFDCKTLSEILGHSDIKTTLALYVHPSDKLKYTNMLKLKLL